MMNDLLTVRQVQDILQVDRTTVYRMLKDGRLHGVKIGQQWRFSHTELDSFLTGSPAVNAAEGSDLSLEILPQTCLQAMQDMGADATGVGAIITHPDGRPITTMSHSSHFCDLIHSVESGRQACQVFLSNLARRPAASSRLITCHAGLECMKTDIKINGEVTAVFIASQFYTTPPDPVVQRPRIQKLATQHQLDAAELAADAAEIPALDPTQRQRVTTWLQ